MRSAEARVPGTGTASAGPDPESDPESAQWVRALGSTGPEREQVLDRLHAMLLRISRHEVNRRGARIGITGPELDDLAHQSAADALLAIDRKIGEFRGESRFTTWAYKFVIFEVSAKVSRHAWRASGVALDTEDWERLPDRFGLDPAHESEWRDLVAALHRAVDRVLSAHQRRIFVALVLNGVPLDALVAELDTNRNAVYKSLFDARRKLRADLVARGYLDRDGGLS